MVFYFMKIVNKIQQSNSAIAISKKPTRALTVETGINPPLSPPGKKLASDYHQNTLFTSILCFLKIRIFILTSEGLGQHHTGAPDLIGILFLLCSWQDQPGASNSLWQKFPTTLFYAWKESM